ncbi:hypothetical protein TD95_003847 [Thielaviopsis punctulata]|uniref:Mannan endo-1,6-alpha-mannosidase n=1 Tax=Thielaviopsis punctulata TaxID=72032 RepID=A0A0F4ZGQ0_9PEZI|nr:hypothetical protein TD95_003847 [Thielaviopsis punctulata]
MLKSRLGTTLFAVVAAAENPFSIASNPSIIESARTLAYDTMAYYKGNLSGNVPGVLPGPPPAGDYYWWEGGALWGAMIDYWHYTGDTSYNDVVKQAMLFQVGEGDDYMPKNYTSSLGNDDQGFWGMSAMLAAETGFENPDSAQPQWLALAQAVFNTQAASDRHDSTCGGGLRWQIPSTNNGYDYKNSIANGVFFNLGARLARYTGNSTYATFANETWNWMKNVVKYIDDDYNIYDGGHVEHNCTDINKAQFSYNSAVFLQGAAFLYNFTNGSAVWKYEVDHLLNATIRNFFPNDTAYEPACEADLSCTTDMWTFKGFVARWMATVTQVAPYTTDIIMPILRHSAGKAIAQCTGGADGRQCGFSWLEGVYDDKTGCGQEMSVMSAVIALMATDRNAPVSAHTGGTSLGNPSAGSNSNTFLPTYRPVKAGDKAAASVLTFFIILGSVSLYTWMCMGST